MLSKTNIHKGSVQFKFVSIHVYAPTNSKARVLFQKRIRQDSSSDDFLLLCRDLLLYREL